MSLEEMKTSKKPFITAAEAAAVMGSDAHTVRCTARQRPELLGFPFTFSGNRMKIPRLAFLKWMGEA